MVISLLLLACAEPQPMAPVIETPAETEETETVADPPADPDPIAQVFRASLDLRGVRPSIDEIQQIQSDPDAYEEMIQDFLEDERLGSRIRSMFAEIFLIRQDGYSVGAGGFGLSGAESFEFVRSVGDETLQILSHIVTEDLPYTELVTGDWTMANELLGEIWPVEYPEGETGWQKVHYTDSRPAAGILATNSMWWRYMTTAANASRGKANAVSKILLCNDYLSKTISFDRTVNLLDEEALRNALKTNPGCASCHNSLDPLASFLWGTYYVDYQSPEDLRHYHPERENLWEVYSGVEPAYFGQPGSGLGDLGQFIAADSRFIECAVERAFRVLIQRDSGFDDTVTLSNYREEFLENELRMKPLFEAIVMSPEYRATEYGEENANRKMVTADMLGSQIEDLTGFAFLNNGTPVLETDSGGLRTLAGGIDGTNVTRSATEPMTTLVLVQERIGQAAAFYAVEWDRDHPDEARLFTEIDFRETPDTGRDRMVAQIQRLHLRLFGHEIEADGPEVEANLELWTQLYEVSLTIEDAWAGVLTVLLRDPDFLFY